MPFTTPNRMPRRWHLSVVFVYLTVCAMGKEEPVCNNTINGITYYDPHIQAMVSCPVLLSYCRFIGTDAVQKICLVCCHQMNTTVKTNAETSSDTRASPWISTKTWTDPATTNRTHWKRGNVTSAEAADELGSSQVEKSKNRTDGVIAGYVLSPLAGLALLISIAFYCRKSRRNSLQRTSNMTQNGNPVTNDSQDETKISIYGTG